MDGKINVELESNLLHIILTTCPPGQESRLELKADGEVVQVSGQVSGATFQRMAHELIGSLPELIGPLTGAAAPTGASLLLSKLPELVQSFAQAVGGASPPATAAAPAREREACGVADCGDCGDCK